MNKGKLFWFLIFLFLILSSVQNLTAYEVGSFFTLGNLSLDPAGTPSEGYPWGLNLEGAQAISDNLSVKVGYNFDPLLKHLVYTLFYYREEYFSLGIGPFFGVFNAPGSFLKSGISTSVQLEFPGVAFLGFRGDSSIGGRFAQTGDYLQERNDLFVGFYVYNAICSVNLLNKRYLEKTATGEGADISTEYSFKTDLYMKNTPYRILLTFGFEDLKRILTNTTTQTTDTYNLGSIILGTKVTIKFSPIISFVADLTSSVYSFGFHKRQVGDAAEQTLGQNITDGATKYYFRLSTGVQIKTDL